MMKGDSPYVTFPSLNIPYLYTQGINNSIVIWDVAKADRLQIIVQIKIMKRKFSVY